MLSQPGRSATSPLLHSLPGPLRKPPVFMPPFGASVRTGSARRRACARRFRTDSLSRFALLTGIFQRNVSGLDHDDSAILPRGDGVSGPLVIEQCPPRSEAQYPLHFLPMRHKQIFRFMHVYSHCAAPFAIRTLRCCPCAIRGGGSAFPRRRGGGSGRGRPFRGGLRRGCKARRGILRSSG